MDITKLPEGATHLDLWLLCGQSNMKGRGFMPEEPKNDQHIVMMLEAMRLRNLACHKIHPGHLPRVA